MLRFLIVPIGIIVLLLPSALAGGIWSVAALFYISIGVFAMDAFLPPQVTDGQSGNGNWLPVVLGLIHFALLGLGLAAVSGATGLSTLERVLNFLAFGMFFGQVSNSNAHELIHSGDRMARRLGVWIYGTLLFGHHVSAHLLVHHVHAASERDPNSARAGEGFWRFFIRAWFGSFLLGFRAESRRRSGFRHAYTGYFLIGFSACTLATLSFGSMGFLSLMMFAGYAQLQLFLSDYVQHYGLSRKMRADGKPEPIGDRHSWNAPQAFSSALMLNAPLHSDHHTHPSRSFRELRLDRHTMPVLPYPLPIMATLALFPRRWRRVMDPRVRAWNREAGAP